MEIAYQHHKILRASFIKKQFNSALCAMTSGTQTSQTITCAFWTKIREELDRAIQFSVFDKAQAPDETHDEAITVASYQRKKIACKPLPKELPREQIIHDLTAEEKICLGL